MKSYSIAKSYTLRPGPRYRSEGVSHSGEDFRETVLAPLIKEAINNKQQVLIDLDGVLGYGPSFLEESFGGLIREEHIDYEDIKRVLIIKSDDDPRFKQRIEERYLPQAHDKSIIAKS